MNLAEKQKLFMQLLPRLIDYIHEQGYDISGGDLYRDPRSHGAMGEDGAYGRRYSNHKQRIAIDLNLYLNGEYLIRTQDHQFAGEFWESLHELCRWGGHYNDGNHYSLEHKGRQ